MNQKDEFYGEGEMNQYITIRKWVFNWKFPFIHRLVIRKKLSEWQKLMNKKWSESLDLYSKKIQ